MQYKMSGTKASILRMVAFILLGISLVRGFQESLYAWSIALSDWWCGESPVEGHSRAEEEKCLAAICSNANSYAAWFLAYDLFTYDKCRSNQFRWNH